MNIETYSPDTGEQVWLWPYKAPDIVDFWSYDITIVCDPKDMSLKNLF